MQETQSFRLLGKNDVEEIPCCHVDGKYMVYWEDIEQVFPRLRYVKNGKITVNLMRDSSGKRIIPHCIMHHPGVVLEVVLSAVVEHVPQGPSMATLSFALTDGQDDIPSTDFLLDKTIQGFQNTVIHKLDALQNQVTALHSQVAATQQIVREVVDRLVLIHRTTDAIMTQNFNLAEYDIPRLFIVLPETSRSWDPAATFRTKFRLRFICMGVEHFEQKDGIILPKLHLAMHEGYVIKKPTELFKKYRPLLTVMLKMAKFGMCIAGNFVPVVSTIDAVTSKGIDYSLKCLETTGTQSRMSEDIEVNLAQNNLTNFLTGMKEVDGPDLRLLRSYLLENSSGDPLGNMYRITTQNGYVKWICHDCLTL